MNEFKIEECYTLSHARSLPKDTLEKMIASLNPLLKGRFLETIRCDRKQYVRSPEALVAFIEENYKDEELQRALKIHLKENFDVKSIYQIKDKAKELEKA